MRDRLALVLIRLAARLTTWGFTLDSLREAEKAQRDCIAYESQQG